MEKIILQADKREELGKSKIKILRKEGFVPAVCYKDGKEPINLKVKTKDIFNVLRTKAGENVLITLKIEGMKAKEKTVIIKEIQRDPIEENLLHIDFKEISLTEEIKVKVPVVARGEARDVSKEGGVIEHAIWEVDVECLPTEIPEKIEVEVSGMKIGDSVSIRDLKVAKGVKILNDPDLVVLVAKPPAKAEAKVEEVAEEITEPEVIEKGKKPEEEEEEEEAKEAPPKKEEKNQ